MKYIEISDEDYAALMEFSKELQTQANHSQAFPYFWEPASEKLEINYHNEGEVKTLFDWNAAESTDPENYAECDPELYEKFLRENDVIFVVDDEINQPYETDLETEWIEYILENKSGVEQYSQDWNQKTEHNPSLFLSDAKGYIESNKHHLGRNPHTYARTIQRMPKMEKLVQIIYRMNPQLKENVNHEASRFVFKKETV